MRIHTFSCNSKLINCFGGLKELSFQFCQLKSRPLQFLILVRDISTYETKSRGCLLARTRCRLIAKVAFNERADIFVMYENRILAYSRDPPLEHDADKTVIFLVCRGRGLRQGKSCDNSLRVAVDYRLVELLEFKVRARDIAIGGPGEV